MLKNKKYLTLLDFNKIDPRLIELFSKNETIEYTSSLRQYDNIIAKQIKENIIQVSYDSVQVTKEKYAGRVFLGQHIALKIRMYNIYWIVWEMKDLMNLVGICKADLDI